MKTVYTKEDYEKAKIIIDQYRDQCSKCGAIIGNRWETDMNALKIDLSIDCQSSTALFGDNEKMHGLKHPAMQTGAGYQGLTLIIKKGTDYQLCYGCFKKLVSTIGEFIK